MFRKEIYYCPNGSEYMEHWTIRTYDPEYYFCYVQDNWLSRFFENKMVLVGKKLDYYSGVPEEVMNKYNDPFLEFDVLKMRNLK